MIYLDNAATTFPKPSCLLKEIEKCMQQYCGNPGRSGHILSLKAAEKIYECRETLANFFGSSETEKVIFTLNTTHALNIAIKSLISQDAHVLISNMEHNSVLRPVFKLSEKEIVKFSIFNVMQNTRDIIEDLERKIQYSTKMLVMTHASNICGKVFPIKEIGEFCRRHKIYFVVDAAQSAGAIDINIEQNNISALCVPAHKGLYGAQGLGVVIFGKGVSPENTIIEGGNGTDSSSPYMGNMPPESFEAGTMSTPLISGLNASLKWLKSIGVANINNHEKRLAAMLSERLMSIPGSIVYGTENPDTGIVLYNNTKTSIDNIISELNKNYICTRSGLHCSPLAHRSLGTPKEGAIRFSFGYYNNAKEIDQVYKIVKNSII